MTAVRSQKGLGIVLQDSFCILATILPRSEIWYRISGLH
nr:MAG TPA: hypothetical protein [Caudoviricetes sp.]